MGAEVRWVRCPKCGGPILELEEYVYACKPCNTKYDILIGDKYDTYLVIVEDYGKGFKQRSKEKG